MKRHFFIILLLVSHLTASAQPPATLNVSARGADLRELLRGIAIQHDVNLAFDNTVTGLVTIHLTNAPFEEGLFTLLDVHGFQYTKEGSIYRVTRKPQGGGTLEVQVQAGHLTLVAEDADVRQVIRELGDKAAVNIALDGPSRGRSLLALVTWRSTPLCAACSLPTRNSCCASGTTSTTSPHAPPEALLNS